MEKMDSSLMQNFELPECFLKLQTEFWYGGKNHLEHNVMFIFFLTQPKHR